MELKSIDISSILKASQKRAMKAIVILVLSVVFCDTLAEPLRYREAQQAQTKSEPNEADADQDTQTDEQIPEQGVTEPTIYQTAPAPYPPVKWLPISGLTNGQLLILPLAVRENPEQITFDNSEAEKTTTNESNEQMDELETSEPQTKPSAAHKRPGPTIIIIKNEKSGALKVEAKQETTEMTDEVAEDEKRDKEAQEEVTQMTNAPIPSAEPSGYFIQLPNGSFQRIVYIAPQSLQVQTQSAIASQPTNAPFQQLQQATINPFGYNPITNPKIVTFSSYNAK